MIELMKDEAGRWPSVRAEIQLPCEPTENMTARLKGFCQDLGGLFCRLQAAFSLLPAAERESCGQDGVAAEVSLRIDLEKKEILLDNIFKYCELDFHIFTELLQALVNHFPDCHLTVPSLQGYELAREIRRFLGLPEIECIYLKNDSDERLLMGEALREVSFDGIIEDTEKHYRMRGGREKRKQELGKGRELSMYWIGTDGEEEVLWMQVRIGLSMLQENDIV